MQAADHELRAAAPAGPVTVALMAIVKDEGDVLHRSLASARDFIDAWIILDTGSTDNTEELIGLFLDEIPGELHHTEWSDFSTCRNELLELARNAETPAEWWLTIDADMEIEAHDGLREWLSADPDPAVDAWQVEIAENDVRWRRPCLIRSTYPWEYVGPVHEYLNTAEAFTRPLLGLTLRHFGHPTTREGKWEEYVELLTPGADAGDPRAVFYLADTLKILGRTEEAAAMYERRAAMGSWEEEAWYAAYMAARIRRDVPGLIEAHNRRPWRPEPLRWAARFVTEDGAKGDILFLEQF